MTRPTFLVAVSDGDIYMGFEADSLTLCTNGTDALIDTNDMQMQDGPPSPNDGDEQKFHRHMYFVDGTQYKRLDAHTGEVFDWEAFVGTDAISQEAIAGFIPFESDYSADIVSNTANTIVVSGDASTIIADGDEVIIQSSTGADGSYTVTGTPVFGGGQTTITVVETIPDTSGDGNVSHVTGRSQLITLWRNRIVIAIGPTTFMSAVGDPRNWDFAPPTTSTTQAVATNLSEAGDVGEDVVALMPVSDDLLVVGCRQSIWAVQGDPASGGLVVNISRQVGVLGPDSWTTDPGNNLYFMGTDGLYRYNAGGGLEKITRNRLDNTFSDINLVDTRVILAWDRPREYLYIFQSKENGENPNHFIYDIRTDAFWPMAIPESNGPVSSIYYEADDFDDRGVLLGGRDGFIRRFRDRRANDSTSMASVAADVSIPTNVTIGPFGLDEGMDAVISDVRFVLGENSGDITFDILRGATAEQAARNDAQRSRRVFQLSQPRWQNRRVSANYFVIELSQDILFSTWAMESAELVMTPTGRTRRGRYA